MSRGETQGQMLKNERRPVRLKCLLVELKTTAIELVFAGMNGRVRFVDE